MPLRIALAQINPHVGALEKNSEKIRDFTRQAAEKKADLVLFPELSLTGYPPEDLLLRHGFVDRCETLLQQIAAQAEIPIVVGHPHFDAETQQLFNAASLLRDGKIELTYRKQELPNYGVFDEKRYFTAGNQPAIFPLGEEQVAITLCEDLWHPSVIAQAKRAGATLVLNLNASPFHLGKPTERRETIRARIAETQLPILYANQVGGQDELVFDGDSFMMRANGTEIPIICTSNSKDVSTIDDDAHRRGVLQYAPTNPHAPTNQFNEALFLYEHSGNEQNAQNLIAQPSNQSSEEQQVYEALTLGIRDYVEKNGFPGVVIGLSGGIDSALTLALAVDALGAERVEGVAMPSRYTAEMSNNDAQEEAEQLGITFQTISIEPMFETFRDNLTSAFSGIAPNPGDVTEQNIQARCRGIILMAIANKKNHMVLTTGNKSEMSVGYATLYGDMAGGFAPLKDVPKLLVYRLAEWRNQQAIQHGELPIIPQRVIDRPPSAELAPDQKDEDSLPPYDILDAILERYVEQHQCTQEIIDAGFELETVKWVIRLVNINEYKRRQAPPGVKITKRAFGRERRYPITSGFRP